MTCGVIVKSDAAACCIRRCSSLTVYVRLFLILHKELLKNSLSKNLKSR